MCGAGFGLGLARYLFEALAPRLPGLGGWPATLAVAGLAGGAAWLLALRFGGIRPAAYLALLLPLISAFAPEVDLLRARTLLLGSLGLFGLLIFAAGSAADTADQAGRLPSRSLAPLLPFLLFVILLLLYLRTLAPAVGEADTFEFQVGIARLGIAHGSGYPLLMLVGRLFTLIPAGGTLAFRANLTSAFFGALAAVGVERLARRLGAAPLTALLAGLAFGVSPTLWSRAVEVEAYTLNAAFVSLILILLLRLMEQPGADPRSLYLLAFTLGLSLTNHLTTLVLAPACLAAVGWPLVAGRWLLAAGRSPLAVGGWRPSALSWTRSLRIGPAAPEPPGVPRGVYPTHRLKVQLAIAALLFLLGLSVYLYVPLRWPAVNQGEVMTWTQFASVLTGSEARGAFQWRLPFSDGERYAIVLRKIVGEYGWPGAALALAGAAGVSLRRPRAGLVLGLAYLGYAYFALAFNVPDPDFSAFLIPMHLIAAVMMGAGLHGLLALVSSRLARSHHSSFAVGQSSFVFRHLPLVVGHLSFSLLPLASIWRTLPRVDQSADWARHRLGEYILSQPLAPGAVILADSQKIAPLVYLQAAEGVRPDLDIVVLPDEASYRAALDERLAAGQTVYLGRYLPGLGAGYALSSAGPLARVSSGPLQPETALIESPLAAPLAGGITLAGFAGEPASLAAPEVLRLTLFWQSPEAVDENLLVYLRLVDAAGSLAWQSAGSVPVGSLYPTNAWRPGELVADYHEVPIGGRIAPGTYSLQAGLFPPFRASPDGPWAEVGQLDVTPPHADPTPKVDLRALFGRTGPGQPGALLFGYDAPESVPPGSHFTVTLYWLKDAQESVTALGETRSLAAWPAGSIAPLEYRLTAPAEGDALRLAVDSGLPARCGWLKPETPACPLRPIRLAGTAAAEGSVNFDNQILLLSTTVDTPEARRGEVVDVTLRWQGLRQMAEDYTVFVHLLGPDGLVHGQVDAWPVSGTRATTGWAPGEVIVDRYAVRVEPDAPPGDYQVEVGVYLLASLERLPVLNAEGQPVDDKVLVPGLTVR